VRPWCDLTSPIQATSTTPKPLILQQLRKAL
jgi:hypothetical protein